MRINLLSGTLVEQFQTSTQDYSARCQRELVRLDQINRRLQEQLEASHIEVRNIFGIFILNAGPLPCQIQSFLTILDEIVSTLSCQLPEPDGICNNLLYDILSVFLLKIRATESRLEQEVQRCGDLEALIAQKRLWESSPSGTFLSGRHPMLPTSQLHGMVDKHPEVYHGIQKNHQDSVIQIP